MHLEDGEAALSICCCRRNVNEDEDLIASVDTRMLHYLKSRGTSFFSSFRFSVSYGWMLCMMDREAGTRRSID